MQVWPPSQRDRPVNNGFVAGTPKRLCRPCGDQCTRPTPRAKPLAMKVQAVLLSLRGIFMQRIAFLLRVSAQSVRNWIRAFVTPDFDS
jgi:transposase-like protein